MKFTKECGAGEYDPYVNVIRWRIGDWDKYVDHSRVVFVSDVEDVKLEIVGGNGGAATIVEKTFDLKEAESVEVYAKEHGSELCEESLFCFGSGKVLTGGIIFLVVLASIIGSCMLCSIIAVVCGRCCS